MPFQNYKEAVEYIYSIAPSFQQQGAHAYKPGLGNIIALMQHLGNPHKDFPSIHVAGTNGKGSTCHMLAAIFQSQGYRTALFTSPHLLDFRERIRISGEMISKEEVLAFLNKNEAYINNVHPSFFEITTSLAFEYFSRKHVDIAIIETGLGGRLDSTNIISPLLSIITNISLDHTDLLGETLEEIAMEKAGIIKPHIPVVVGEANTITREVFSKVAEQNSAPICFAQDEPQLLRAEQFTVDGSPRYRYYTRDFGTLECELGGTYQPHNVNTVLAAISHFYGSKSHLPLGREALVRGLKDVSKLTGLMGRWQKLATKPDVYCDTGHNTGGWEYLSRQLLQLSEDYATLYVVFGMAGDKDVSGVVEQLPGNATYFWTQASGKRAMPAAMLSKLAADSGLKGETFSDVHAAIRKALSLAKPNDVIFIGGSSYIVAEALPLFLGE